MTIEAHIPDELVWCEKCKTRHTPAFGEEFHDRVVNPLRDHWDANKDKWMNELAEAIEKGVA
jgi:hypothetical protein